MVVVSVGSTLKSEGWRSSLRRVRPTSVCAGRRHRSPAHELPLFSHPAEVHYSTDYAQICGTNIMRGTI